MIEQLIFSGRDLASILIDVISGHGHSSVFSARISVGGLKAALLWVITLEYWSFLTDVSGQPV